MINAKNDNHFGMAPTRIIALIPASSPEARGDRPENPPENLKQKLRTMSDHDLIQFGNDYED
jgi:hypothetical protein